MNVEANSIVLHLKNIINRYQEKNRRINLRYSTSERIELFTSLVAAIERYAPKDSFYYTNLMPIIRHVSKEEEDYESLEQVFGIVVALKTDYEAGDLRSVAEIIHADVFSDYLDMARYLLDQNYKDAAAVIIGGTLEEHLRKLCIKHEIPVITDKSPKKAESMNSELCQKSAYKILDQKNVTAWLDLRNKAAHGKYDEYSFEQVNLMHQGISEFISRIPA